VTTEQDAVQDLMKRTAVALKRAGVPFALCGGYAAWARGAPEPEHDADFLVAEVDARRAAEGLVAGGLQVEEPPEDWLVKVVADDVFVDVLWRAGGGPVDPSLVARADVLPVLSVEMPVLTATDVMVTKLAALDEHYCDFSRLLPPARALREQVDWDLVRRDVADNDFAMVFLVLLERLGILERVPTCAGPGAEGLPG
jgi:hypothetical protein